MSAFSAIPSDVEQNRLIAAMMAAQQQDPSAVDPTAQAAPAATPPQPQPQAGGGMNSAPDDSSSATIHRIDDDPQSRHNADLTNSTGSFADQASGEASGLRASLADRMRQASTPTGPSHIDQLQQEYDALGKRMDAPPPKMSLLRKIGLGLLTAAGGGAGVAAGLQQRTQNQLAEKNQLRERQNSLLTNMEAERRMQEQEQLEGERDVSAYDRELSRERQLDLTSKMRQDEQNTLEAGRNQRLLDQNKAQGERQQAGFQQQDELENKRLDNQGSLQLDEDDQGNPVTFNTRTGAVRPAAGVHKAGTFQKGQGAADDALNYATLYEKQTPTGPGDEALMEKYFELAKPSSGFRMTDAQQKMLRNSRSWIGSAEGIEYHAKTGVWFTPTQRSQIIGTMKTLSEAKSLKSKMGGGSSGRRVINISQ